MDSVLAQGGSRTGVALLTVIAALLVVLGVIVLLVRSAQHIGNWFRRRSAGSPLAALQRRYAQGEIGTAEYERVRSMLLSDENSKRPRWWRDHTLLVGSVMTLVFTLLALISQANDTSTTPVIDLFRPAADAVTRPWEAQVSGQVREFQLSVGRTQWELGADKLVEAYAYNGQVPGPELRVTEGDIMRVTVTNELAEPTTIHWHGVELPVEMDGVPELSQEPIPPGGSFTYEFVATPAGTRWYHSHFNEITQQGSGLAGALIIEPREAKRPAPDREYVLVTSEWAMASSTAHAPTTPTPSTSSDPGGMSGMMGSGAGQHHVDTFLFNGKPYPHPSPLTVRQGERVRLRLINAGVTATQSFALAGHTLTITHSDGNALAKPVDVEAVLLGVGERVDVEFVADNPGRWQLRGLMPGHADRGLAIDVVYEGHEREAVQGIPPHIRLRPARYADLAGPQPQAGPDRTYDLMLSGGMMGSNVWTINGRRYPDTEPLDVQPGERVRLKLFNMSMEDHPMHLHGHTFQVVAIGGRPVDGLLKDTLTLRHMEQYEIEFTANNPGVWLFHCHNLEHMDGGLVAEVHYR
jgi:FtsP/CotA-like multicopper oxidase with cupredoxin domain